MGNEGRQPRPNDTDRSDDERIDEASAESFPASDAPAYRDSHIGGPARDRALARKRLGDRAQT